jgi:hypothetical protein
VTAPECAEQPIGEREYDVEVDARLAMMELVVSVNILKEQGSLERSVARIVHAPVEILVRCKVPNKGKQSWP